MISEEDFKIKTIAIPNRTYLIDKNKTDKMLNIINNCTSNNKIQLYETVSFIYNNLVHISFTEFVKNLVESVKKFEETISEMDYILYIPHPDTSKQIHEKSNYWVSQMVFRILKKKPKNIYSIFPKDYFKEGKENILICDDASFSGTQMCDRVIYDIESIVLNKPTIISIHLVIPFMTNISINKINDNKLVDNTSYFFYYNYLIRDLIIPHLSKNNQRSLLYFDHRIPDYKSTYAPFFNNGWNRNIDDHHNCVILDEKTQFSIMKSCKIDNETDCTDCDANAGEGCPIIPYRDKHKENELVELLKPDDFFKKYIAKDSGRKKKKKYIKNLIKKSRKKKSKKKDIIL